MIFWIFIALSSAVLGLSLGTRQREAAAVTAFLIVTQLVSEVAILAFDAPVSLAPAMIGDMLLAWIYAGIWERHPRLWLLAGFFIEATAGLIHAIFAALWLSARIDPHALFFGYYLALNILFVMFIACNAWPGAHDVAIRLRSHLRRARARRSLALRQQKRG